MAIRSTACNIRNPALVLEALPLHLLALAWVAGLVFSGLAFPGRAYAALQLNSAAFSVASPAQGPASVVYVTGGGTVTAAVTGSTIGSTNWQATSWQIGTGAVTCANHNNFNTNNATTTVTFNITAPAAAGTYDTSFIAYSNNGCSSNASNTLVLAASIVVDNTAPSATSINLASANPSSAASVSWTVVFSEDVVGVAAGNFTLAQGGGLGGAAITSVTGSGTTWTVTASTGSGSGTLGLNLTGAAGITDIAGNALTGVPLAGGVYTVNGSTAVTVTSSPTLCVDDPGIGTQPWTGLTNVGTRNNVYAQASGINRQITHYLKCTGYNFAVPAGATINGITVGVWRYSRRTMSDQAMQLVKANVIQPANLATLTRFPNRNTQVLYGGATNLWGNTWTPADINDAAFGAAFAALRGPFNTTDTAFVDYMPITIDYSLPSGPDHLEIRSAATGLTCASNPLTVVACQDAGCTMFYTAGVSGTLSAAGTPAVNWDGSTGGAAGSGFVIPAGSGSVIKYAQAASAGAVTFGIPAAMPTPINATTCNFGTNAPTNNNCVFTANTAGFIFSNTTTGNTYTIPAQVSGIAAPALYLRAVQASTANPAVCTPAIIGSTASVNMGYSCNNPAACQPGSLATINATAITPAGTAVNLGFDANGSAPISARYDDAGQITLNASATVTPFGGATAITLNGGSNSFAVAPHHFGFSAVTAAPIKAGNNFAATVTAYNGLATPAATANFGLETPSAESVTITFAKCQPTGTNSSSGTFSGSVGTFTGGVASAANLNWSEVGNGDLVATLASGSYLGSGLTATGNTGTGGTICSTGASNAGNIGPFIPDHFNTAIIDGCASCGFTYSGQPFTVYVTARNGLGTPTTTVNYDGTANTSPNFAKNVTLSAWDAATGVTPDPGPGTFSNTALALTSFVSGLATLNAAATMPFYTFTNPMTAPTVIRVRADDTDGVSSLLSPLSSSTEGQPGIRSGRINISNAHGSELLKLPIAVTAQYWNGSYYVTSATDSSSSFAVATPPAMSEVAFGNYQKNLAAVTVSNSPYTVTFSGGAGEFSLDAPGTGNNGSVDMSIPALTGASCAVAPVPLGCYLPSNTARATFGVYKASKKFIYQREDY